MATGDQTGAECDSEFGQAELYLGLVVLAHTRVHQDLGTYLCEKRVVWQRRLRERSLTYWRLVTWHTVTRHIRLHDLHPAYRQAMVDLVHAATEGKRNALACKVVDLTPRFESVMTYLATHRRLPGSPVLSLEPDGLIILDGGHRMAAYFYCRGDISARASAHLPMPPDAIQRYWIGAPHALLVPVMFPSEDRIDVPHEAQGAV